MDELRVEVFPLDAARWIAVIETDDGPFSTEARTARALPAEIAAAIREVLGRDAAFTAVDDRGRPWSPEAARRSRLPRGAGPWEGGPGGIQPADRRVRRSVTMGRPTAEQAPPSGISGRASWVVVGSVVAAVGLVGCQVLPGSGRSAYAPPPGSPVASTFDVPTYDWDGDSAMKALVGGTLWFTDEGCPLVSGGDGAGRRTGAVFFPGATGVTYDNGVRAVVDGGGRVFAVEGQEFSYAGGYVIEPDSDLGREWLAQCPDTDLREGAVVNDRPAGAALTAAPAPPVGAGPTAPTTDEELGYFTVPTFAWESADGADGEHLEGVVAFTDEGCPVIESQAGGGPVVTGLIFPNAEGYRAPDGSEGPAIFSRFSDGSYGQMALEGRVLSSSGASGRADDERWTSVCGESPVDAVFSVQDTSTSAG